MAFIKLQFKPGVNRDQTDYSNEGGWYECDKIRFRSGYPQKLGGWTKVTPERFIGICRQMWNWITSFSDNLLALGTEKKLYIEAGGYYYNVTPLRDVNPTYTGTNTNNCVSVTSGVNAVTFNLAVAYGALTGNYVQITGVAGSGSPEAIGGIPVSQINGNYPITVINSTAFSIQVGTNATSNVSATGGNAITISFEYEPGNAVPTAGYGWGTPGVVATKTVGFTNGSADITGTGLPAVNTQVTFSTTGTLPTNFNTTDTYYVVSNTGPNTTIQVSGTIGGSAIVAGSAGTGTQTMQVIGGWGRDAWGLGTRAAPTDLPQRDWWLDNYQNDLVANIRNGPAFWWERGAANDPAGALATRAIWLKDYAYNWAISKGFSAGIAQDYADAVPAQVMQLLVSQQDGHLIAFGAVPYPLTSAADFDPMVIRWANQGNPENWIEDGLTTAGSLRLSRGSRIVRALPVRQEILMWTDTNLYTLQPTYTLDVFKPQEYADNISIISPRAVASAANITYWMGQDKFYAYTGRVETLPCTLRDHVFNNLNYSQAAQIVCGTNEQWNEVWWFYPTENSNYNDAYVIYNHLERIWYYGSIERSAWLDSPLRTYPMGANTAPNATTGLNYYHEDGTDEDGAAMRSFIRSSDFDLADGDQFMLTRRIIPDIDFAGSTAGTTPEATLEIRHRNFPGSALQTETGENGRVIQTTLNQYTTQIFLRARARQMALKIISENAGVQWQLGAPRLDARPDGTR